MENLGKLVQESRSAFAGMVWQLRDAGVYGWLIRRQSLSGPRWRVDAFASEHDARAYFEQYTTPIVEQI
jgi:hypothetical protein